MKQPRPSRVTARLRQGNIERDSWEVLIDGAVISGATFSTKKEALRYAEKVLAYYEGRDEGMSGK